MKTPKTPPAVSSAFNLNFSANDLSENEMLRHSDSSHLLTNDPTQYSPICQLPLFVSVLLSSARQNVYLKSGTETLYLIFCNLNLLQSSIHKPGPSQITALVKYLKEE